MGQSLRPSQPGIRRANRAGDSEHLVWVFPPLMVCLDCGYTEFVLPTEQLEQLKSGDFPTQSQESARAS